MFRFIPLNISHLAVIFLLPVCIYCEKKATPKSNHLQKHSHSAKPPKAAIRERSINMDSYLKQKQTSGKSWAGRNSNLDDHWYKHPLVSPFPINRGSEETSRALVRLASQNKHLFDSFQYFRVLHQFQRSKCSHPPATAQASITDSCQSYNIIRCVLSFIKELSQDQLSSIVA